ncbi:protein spinster homolog 1 [Dendrobates tinctorius]|uniref:protein spinster homolog 1 n=1 Tax=Dendrobates tinctorius TaxID=92724 RepID=UPI003CCA0223
MMTPHDHADTTPFLTQADDVDEVNVAAPLQHVLDEHGDDNPDTHDVHSLTGISYRRSVTIVGILFYINLLNYMDRFTVAGVLTEIGNAFSIHDGSSGLIQTVFICSYMVLAPVFGYLGDRWNRKYIICAGISFWSIITLCSSFIPNQYFPLFLLTRGLVGVGEASYSTIAPTIIADLFVADQRTRMLSVFYFAIPVGCGLGYIAGSKVAIAANKNWHWALRVTPGLGLIAVLLVIFFVKEPPRGAVERKSDKPLSTTPWLADVKALLKNRSFMLVTLGFTTVAFVTGALALWAPSFLTRARTVLYKTDPHQDNDEDSLIFGLVTVVTGILGVGAGVEISKRYRKVNPRADPIVCACGMLCSAPFLYLSLVFADTSLVATYAFIFIGETLLSLNWAIVADMVLYVVIPTRRSTAEALQIMVSHLLGDAGSPYLIGVISDQISKGQSETSLLKLRSLEYALMMCSFVGALGGGLFLASALFIEKDRKQAEMVSEGIVSEVEGIEDRIVVPKHGGSTRVPVSSVLV